MQRLVLGCLLICSLSLSQWMVGCGGSPDDNSNTNTTTNSNTNANANTNGNQAEEKPTNEPQAGHDAGATNNEPSAESNADVEAQQERAENEEPTQEEGSEESIVEPDGRDAGADEEPAGEAATPEWPADDEPAEKPAEAMADQPSAQTDSYNVDSNGVAVQGYDVVAYFLLQKPTQGDAKYAVRWSGATWHFSSDPHRQLFQANPTKYAPQYGGYCAWAVSQGYLASIDPIAWKVVNQKLYLNFSLSVQKQWEQDIPNNIAQADKNWPSLRPKP
ncbi:MAG: hypothetical protein EP343_02900 [Deltaproteobacteria bacterium]|nr:MAG: hypothetical protein EP343_02900 [Deltaproteobacteria bacterium]